MAQTTVSNGSKLALMRNEIDAACDIMRRDDGTSSTLDYIEQLSWLLFLRVFEGSENLKKELARQTNRPYQQILEDKYHWSAWATLDWIGKPLDCLVKYNLDPKKFLGDANPNQAVIIFVNDVLFPALRNLYGTPEREKIASIFSEITGNKMKDAHNFMDVVTKLNAVDPNNYQDTQLLSQIYENLLLRMGSDGSWSGEFYTPRPAIRFMIDYLEPQLGETVFDPFAGSAGFLVEAYLYLKEKLGHSMTPADYAKLQNQTFYAQEKKQFPHIIGTMNLILHGVQLPNYVRVNTLEQEILAVPEEKKHDLILTNPPFGGKENARVQDKYPYKVGATEALALQYIMRYLKAGGRCGVVLPEGQVLFGSGKFAEIRKELLEKFNVTAVVSLPAGAFSLMGAGVKTSILFFEKTGQPTTEIWYYEMNQKLSKNVQLTDEDFQPVLAAIKNRSVGEHSWLVKAEELAQRDYDLSARNPHQQKEVMRSSAEILAEIETTYQKMGALLSEIKETIKK